MAQWQSKSFAAYSGPGPVFTLTSSGDFDLLLDDLDPPPDNLFEPGEQFSGTFEVFAGTYTYLGHVFVAGFNGVSYSLRSAEDLGDVTYPTSFNVNDLNTGAFTVCFAPGTMIATQTGAVAVEELAIGDPVRTSDDRFVQVKWIGRQTVWTLYRAEKIAPVRFRAGSLGGGLPLSDLTVTADHGMVLDGLVINASALVNGATIDWVPVADLPDRFTVYHVETEAHEVILANGAPAESFVDIPGRMAFDNYDEYLVLYGCERIIPEMNRPRITSRRLLPDAIKARLGLEQDTTRTAAIGVA